ncbi:alanine--tRNA ligase-related protein [Kocuria rhizophila]|nr:alanine--tRNA ligase-related protein [Kocuria rhizophila]
MVPDPRTPTDHGNIINSPARRRRPGGRRGRPRRLIPRPGRSLSRPSGTPESTAVARAPHGDVAHRADPPRSTLRTAARRLGSHGTGGAGVEKREAQLQQQFGVRSVDRTTTGGARRRRAPAGVPWHPVTSHDSSTDRRTPGPGHRTHPFGREKQRSCSLTRSPTLAQLLRGQGPPRGALGVPGVPAARCHVHDRRMVPFIPYFPRPGTPPFTGQPGAECIRTLDIDEVAKPPATARSSRWPATSSFGDYSESRPSPSPGSCVTIAAADEQLRAGPGAAVGHRVEGEPGVLRPVARHRGFARRRIQRVGRDENYWDTGQPGPRVRLSVLRPRPALRQGRRSGGGRRLRYIEIWNLVFMRSSAARATARTRSLGDLPQQNIDTGLGVERLAMLLQGVENFRRTRSDPCSTPRPSSPARLPRSRKGRRGLRGRRPHARGHRPPR